VLFLSLDPEQNKEFSDHYLEVPFDLRRLCLFVPKHARYNSSSLKDRMEIMSWLYRNRKFKIAKKFLWPKTLKSNGINDKKVEISEKA
jgi:ATP-dependent Lon protease